jgi:serine/threonine protein kinase
METIGKRVCPACGALVFESNPCPVCLLRGAINPDAFGFQPTISTSSSELDFEHYRVLQNEDGTPIELGRGAMGVTYKAVDINLRSVVALKVLNVEILGDRCACRRFVREARAAARVRHENVASVFHLGKQGHSYFYTMEFVDGEPLDKIIRHAGRLELPVALRVIALVAAGLEAIARQELVHRDIKPSNIMVTLEGGRIVNAKIIDLGLAKSAVDDTAISVISNPGTFAGTPAYASPEQFAGISADIRSDLYSLGVMLWEMVCGELPFRGSPLELRDQHQYAPLPIHKLGRIPQPVSALLEILLEKDPGRRFQRPAELQRAVLKALEPQSCWVTTNAWGSEGQAVRPDESVRQARCTPFGLKRHGIAWLLAFAIGVLGLVCARHSSPGDVRSLFGLREEAPTETSIAVLPFENISPNEEDVYFADGVQDEILRNLAGTRQLKVVSRTSVMRYRGNYQVDLREVANALGVTNVLEGTVRRDGNHVRVSTALVDARNDNMIWTDSYDRDLTDIFAVQSEIAQQVAAKLNARLNADHTKAQRQKGE